MSFKTSMSHTLKPKLFQNIKTRNVHCWGCLEYFEVDNISYPLKWTPNLVVENCAVRLNIESFNFRFLTRTSTFFLHVTQSWSWPSIDETLKFYWNWKCIKCGSYFFYISFSGVLVLDCFLFFYLRWYIFVSWKRDWFSDDWTIVHVFVRVVSHF